MKTCSSKQQNYQSEPLLILQMGDKKWEVSWDVVSNRPQATSLVRGPMELVGPELVGKTSIGKATCNQQRRKIDRIRIDAGSGKLRSFISEIAASQNRRPQDAMLSEAHNVIRIEKEVTGKEVDVAATLLKAAQALSDGKLVTVDLVVKECSLLSGRPDLNGINGRLASFTTTYDMSDEDRNHNIRIAAGKLNGMLIKSGEVVSFNDRAGTRLKAERGISHGADDGKHRNRDGLGRWRMPVSSTFYNAALLADFTVLERSAHYQPPAYVPLGLDATVADGQIGPETESKVRPFLCTSRLLWKMAGWKSVFMAKGKRMRP